MTTVLPNDVKADIGDVIRMFEFKNAEPGGQCVARAVCADAVFKCCGLSGRRVVGGMLYRAGPHPLRDTLRFCLSNNMGGYLRQTFIGHVWHEIDGEIAGFSAGDWQTEAAQIYATATDPADRTLGPVKFAVPPPEIIWQPAYSLQRGWQRTGEPELSRVWYGGYVGRKEQDFAVYSPIVKAALPQIRPHIERLKLLERVAEAKPQWTGTCLHAQNHPSV